MGSHTKRCHTRRHAFSLRFLWFLRALASRNHGSRRHKALPFDHSSSCLVRAALIQAHHSSHPNTLHLEAPNDQQVMPVPCCNYTTQRDGACAHKHPSKQYCPGLLQPRGIRSTGTLRSAALLQRIGHTHALTADINKTSNTSRRKAAPPGWRVQTTLKEIVKPWGAALTELDLRPARAVRVVAATVTGIRMGISPMVNGTLSRWGANQNLAEPAAGRSV